MKRPGVTWESLRKSLNGGLCMLNARTLSVILIAKCLAYASCLYMWSPKARLTYRQFAHRAVVYLARRLDDLLTLWDRHARKRAPRFRPSTGILALLIAHRPRSVQVISKVTTHYAMGFPYTMPACTAQLLSRLRCWGARLGSAAFSRCAHDNDAALAARGSVLTPHNLLRHFVRLTHVRFSHTLSAAVQRNGVCGVRAYLVPVSPPESRAAEEFAYSPFVRAGLIEGVYSAL